MRKIICFSHGNLARGMTETVKMIAGNFDNIDYYCAYVREDEDIEKEIDRIILENQENELFIVSDIFGGSVNNEWIKRINKGEKIHLIAGMNLAFVIELLVLINDSKMKGAEVVQKAMTSARENFVYCNQLQMDLEEDDF
ncbi:MULTISPECIES: PTS sugar transporter subunit IIA [Enterococcaceae]|uniref:PTS fructose IIA subunit n=1 Tax=Vagococcus vulneris TaxID=1977869 RepID=A0A430A2H6_9ENTE|nr:MULTISPECIES: PTS fructose IIA component [Enterococcaceae]EJE4563077.1 PTS fructose IIA subunit [Enterococcus faecium]EJX51198.1 PTS system fructose IIA component [Enterococcus faecium R497]EKY7883021.1 PTS fructose IIA subunit [Enterococcus faecium]EKZ0059267.1 PTS fructose IIA subunit [Enterococcus faecium]EKZ0497309.1 PTS fructose IIA subunit [Enterococcus faecium]